MDKPAISPFSSTSTLSPPPLKLKSTPPKFLLILLPLLVIALIAGTIFFTKPFNLFQPKKIVTIPTPTPTPLPTITIDKRFLSIPDKNDKILDSLPKKIEQGIIYFYWNTKYGVKGELASYLESKIIDIDKTQKSLSVKSANGINKISITTKDYTIVKNIKLNTASKPDVTNISFDDLEIGDNISISGLQYDNQNYIAGTIVKKE